MADKQQQQGQQSQQGQQGQQQRQQGQQTEPRTVGRERPRQAGLYKAGTAQAPKQYPNKPCYSDLLWLCYYEIDSGYSDESRHTTGTDGLTAAWKPGFPESVTLPQEYYQE